MEDHAGRRTPILSYGMGVESTGILVRWILEPSCRDFELSDLIVVTAQTGHEFADTKECVEVHLLPLLRAHGVRWVQIARAGNSSTDGIVVLSDTRSSEICYTAGAYKLGDELVEAGTVPEIAHGRRKCSVKSKGWVLDTWIDQELAGLPFRHFIGFNFDESNRVTRDCSYSSVERHSEYPLLEWGWSREATLAYLKSVFGIIWKKSCCSFCPFSGGREEIMRRYRVFAEQAAEALMMEYVSMALNPRMTLYSGKSLLNSIRADNNARALELFNEMLAAEEWAIYRVRRIYFKGSCWRKTEIIKRGSRDAIHAGVLEMRGAGSLNTVTEHLRIVVSKKDRAKEFPREEFYVGLVPYIVSRGKHGHNMMCS